MAVLEVRFFPQVLMNVSISKLSEPKILFGKNRHIFLVLTNYFGAGGGPSAGGEIFEN